MQEQTASAPEGRNYEQLLLQFRPFRAVCLLCIYIALTDYAMQFCPFRALRAGTVFDLLSYKQLSLLDKLISVHIYFKLAFVMFLNISKIAY